VIRFDFASYTGTAPIDVSSGDNNRHRLNPGGNRRLNHALHIAAVVQYRMPCPGLAATTSGASATRARPTSRRCAASLVEYRGPRPGSMSGRGSPVVSGDGLVAEPL
jgi:hypothetical protein